MSFPNDNGYRLKRRYISRDHHILDLLYGTNFRSWVPVSGPDDFNSWFPAGGLANFCSWCTVGSLIELHWFHTGNLAYLYYFLTGSPANSCLWFPLGSLVSDCCYGPRYSHFQGPYCLQWPRCNLTRVHVTGTTVTPGLLFQRASTCAASLLFSPGGILPVPLFSCL